MNPLRLTAENYRSFERLELDLPSGTVAIVGENGAGKSSIVNVVDLALFGSRSLGNYLTEGIDEPMQIELEFEHRGELYRVRRSYSPKGRGQTKLDFEEMVSADGFSPEEADRAVWAPLTRETAAATQALIEETLGLSRETFRASAFLAQGDGAAFTEAQPRERKAILAEVLGLGIWDELLQLAKVDRARLETAAQRIRTELELAREEAAKRPALEARRAELNADAELLVASVAKAEDRKQRVEHEIAGTATLRAEVKAAHERLVDRTERLAQLDKRIAELREKVRQAATLRLEHARLAQSSGEAERLQQELKEAVERQRAQAEYTRLATERQRLIGEANDLNERAHALREEVRLLEENGPGATTCDRCGQTLGAEALQTTLANMRGEASRLDEQAKRQIEFAERVELPEYVPPGGRSPEDIQPELHLATNGERRLAEVKGELAGLDEYERLLQDFQAQREPLQEEVREARIAGRDLSEKLPDLTKLESERADLQRVLTSTRDELDSARQELAVADAELKRLEEIAHKIGGSERLLADLQGQLDAVLLAERAYGRDGIPALIVENAAIPQIELEANRILAELGTSFTVELQTQRALKGGGVAEALDIVVSGPAGARPYETFSGGERTRLNLALRIALARLLAHRRGAEVRMLVIDEPEFLDEAGVARLAEVLRGLSPDFERIFLISHQPALRDAFDEVLTVVKDGERSRVEQAVVEEVAA